MKSLIKSLAALSSYPHVRDERHLYLWNSDYKFYNYCSLFDAEYMEVTSSGPAVISVRYDDGFGNTYSTDLHFTDKQ